MHLYKSASYLGSFVGKKKKNLPVVVLFSSENNVIHTVLFTAYWHKKANVLTLEANLTKSCLINIPKY